MYSPSHCDPRVEEEFDGRFHHPGWLQVRDRVKRRLLLRLGMLPARGATYVCCRCKLSDLATCSYPDARLIGARGRRGHRWHVLHVLNGLEYSVSFSGWHGHDVRQESTLGIDD